MPGLAFTPVAVVGPKLNNPADAVAHVSSVADKTETNFTGLNNALLGYTEPGIVEGAAFFQITVLNAWSVMEAYGVSSGPYRFVSIQTKYLAATTLTAGTTAAGTTGALNDVTIGKILSSRFLPPRQLYAVGSTLSNLVSTVLVPNGDFILAGLGYSGQSLVTNAWVISTFFWSVADTVNPHP